MISNRAPAIAERVDAILDEYLSGIRSRHKRDQHLRRELVKLRQHPKLCGCARCEKIEQKEEMPVGAVSD